MKQYLIETNNGCINVLEGVEIKDDNNFKAIILNVHGLGSHFQFTYDTLDEIENRDKFFSKFNIKTFGFEFIGHGLSDGERCCIKNINHLIDDLNNVINHIAYKYRNKQIFICAESMGAAITLKYIHSKMNYYYIGGIILLSPLCGIDDSMKPNFFLLNIFYTLSYFFPTAKLNITKKIENTTITINEYMDAVDKCPYKYKDTHKICTLTEMYNICLWLNDNINAKTIDKPVLLCHGLHDTITNVNDSIKIFKRLDNKLNELVLLDTAEHSLLIPNNYDDVIPNYIYIKIYSFIMNVITSK